MKRILIVRTDRLGDVILSMPVAAAMKRAYPEAQLTLLCRKISEDIGLRNPDIDRTLTIDHPDGIDRMFFQLVGMIKRENFDCAIIVHPTLSLALLTAAARIPVRIGTGYRYYSFLFNKRHYEHRKESIKHEVEYNLGLLKVLNISVETPEFRFCITEEDKEAAEKKISEIGIDVKKGFCVVHPGSGGSAMDWPLRFFAITCEMISRDLKLNVIVTWGPNENHIVNRLREETSCDIWSFDEVLSLPVLGAVLQKAQFLLAPSTGILHFAYMVGTSVIGLYPPVRHESPVRWGPYGLKDSVLVPDIKDCPDCKGKPCRKLSCMELITPAMAVDKIKAVTGKFS